ncbi:DUF2130 domain-containing protein [Bacteroidetes/Chlorobi group bacterium ChocPot_Mid]|nr:MAG: DUF2130 domain-containing protein [Bacteroidetes/Chlorobi group bacterium ChocPot_Mid]
MAKNTINCPQCGADIDVSDVLYQQIAEEVRQKNIKENAQKEYDLKQKEKHLNILKSNLDKQQSEFDSKVQTQVSEAMKIEKRRIEAETKKILNEENAEIIADKDRELNEKSEQLKELSKAKTENERLKREKDELKDKLELENEQKLNQILREEKTKIKKQADDEHFLKHKEYEKTIEDMKLQMAEVQRKAEQGSMQLQGEVQELELESILREKYPFDKIIEVKKGQRGADCLQLVRTKQGLECGKIYYESKRTKDFQNGWIQKLKEDNLEVKADIMIIVTQVMPDGEQKFFLKDGVWVCPFTEIRAFSFVIRQSLLKFHSISITQQNKDSKMEMLYNYLTSQEFKGQLEAIIEGFSSLQSGYQDEKKKMQKIWAEREKQLEKIITNTVTFYGSLKGIAGASIPDIPLLEDGNGKLLNSTNG